MTPEFAEIAIITMAFSTTLGYLIGIVNYLVEAKKVKKTSLCPLSSLKRFLLFTCSQEQHTYPRIPTC